MNSPGKRLENAEVEHEAVKKPVAKPEAVAKTTAAWQELHVCLEIVMQNRGGHRSQSCRNDVETELFGKRNTVPVSHEKTNPKATQKKKEQNNRALSVVAWSSAIHVWSASRDSSTARYSGPLVQTRYEWSRHQKLRHRTYLV